MAENRIKSWLDIAPTYLDFGVKFLRHPPSAFESLRFETDIETEVSADLTSILLGGIALAYLLVLATGSAELAKDPGYIPTLVRRLATEDVLLLPASALLATFSTAIVTHLPLKLFRSSAGRMEGTVNAALGFAAIGVPLATAAICLGVQFPETYRLPAAATVGLALAGFTIVYFPWSLSAVHDRMAWYQAFFALSAGSVMINIVSSLFTWLVLAWS